MSRVSLLAKSEYGDLVSLLYNGTEQAALLALTYDEQRRGGPGQATFYVKENTATVFRPGVIVSVAVDGVERALFDVSGDPAERTEDGRVAIACVGLSERLKKAFVSLTLSSVSIKQACLACAAGAESVGIVIDADYLALPSTVMLSQLEVTDSSVFDIIETLVDYANGSAGDDVYAWTIDTSKRLVVTDIRANEASALFEGFSMEAPTVEVNTNDLINSLILWRKKETEDGDEYVDTYQDWSSIDAYGLLEKKVTLPYYAADADCAQLAQGLLARYAVPETALTANSITTTLQFKNYAVSIRPVEKWSRLFSGDDIGALDVSRSRGTSYALAESSMVGKFSAKCTLGATASGYVEKTVEPYVVLPKKIRLFLKGAGARVGITLVDKDGDTASFSLDLKEKWERVVIILRDTEWAQHSLWYQTVERKSPILEDESPVVPFDGEGDNAEEDGVYTDTVEGGVFDSAELGLFRYTMYATSETDGEVALYVPLRSSVRSLSAVRISWESRNTEVFIDYIDCLADKWKRFDLPLAKATYALQGDALIASAEFGNTERTTEDSLTELWSTMRRNQ